MKRPVLLAIVIVVGMHATVRAGDDLEAYIQSIRDSGVSETGRGQLSMVASEACRATILEYRVDPESGRYWGSYTSAVCPNPNADSAELTEWKEARIREANDLIAKLKLFADTDDSGFVTTEEASAFRDLIEYGYLVAQVIRDEGPDMDALCRATGKGIGENDRKMRDYAGIAARISSAGVQGLPDISALMDHP